MKKQYIAPSLTAISDGEPLTPLCGSKAISIGSSSEEQGGTKSSAWSNQQEKPHDGGMWSHMDD